MPAEHTGLVKENYLWKCLLKRSAGPQGVFIKVGNNSEFIDRESVERAWAPIISAYDKAICRAYDKAPDRTRKNNL